MAPALLGADFWSEGSRAFFHCKEAEIWRSSQNERASLIVHSCKEYLQVRAKRVASMNKQKFVLGAWQQYLLTMGK